MTSEENGLVDIADCMESIWPLPSSRPSLRWFRKLAADRVIPSVRIGRRVFFSVPAVREHIDAHFNVGAL